jgi:hypothetical protein
MAKAVTETLADPLFLSYLYMVMSLEALIGRLSRWCEACCCHEHLFPHMSARRR